MLSSQNKNKLRNTDEWKKYHILLIYCNLNIYYRFEGNFFFNFIFMTSAQPSNFQASGLTEEDRF